MLLGLLREGEGVAARVLENLGADPTNIRTQVCVVLICSYFYQLFVSMWIHMLFEIVSIIKICNGWAQVIRMVGESADSVTATVGPGSSSNKMPTLEEYGTNLTKLAEEVIDSS